MECWVSLPDLHFTSDGDSHDPEALECAESVVSSVRPHGLVILGDWLDAPQFSSHAKRSLSEDDRSSWTDDLTGVIAILRRLRRRVRGPIVYIEGNHENRVERLATTSGALRSVFEAIAPRHVLTKAIPDLVWVPYVDPPLGHYAITPSLWALHGWSTSVHASHAHLDRSSNFSIIHGHSHRMQMDTRKDPRSGRLLHAMSPGCLANLQPRWTGADPTNWSHGLTISYVNRESDEHWSFLCQIDRGETVLPNGKRVRAA